MARILIADDSMVMRRMLGGVLRRAGHEVIEAADGLCAVREAGMRELDLAITDLNMPKLDGLLVIERLRAMPGFGFRPILVLTTQTQHKYRREARRRGATGWINKPFEEDQLLGALRRLLDEPQ